MISTGSYQGHFLVSMPLLMDPNFHQTVTFICEYTPQSAMGIVINRQDHQLLAQSIFEELGFSYLPDVGKTAIFIGGPVNPNELFVLHDDPKGWGDTFEVTAGVGLSNTKEIVEAIAQNDGPENYILALGCAGWGPGQLDYEMRENTWLVSPVYSDILFEVPVENRWQQVLSKNGIDPALFSGVAGNA